MFNCTTNMSQKSVWTALTGGNLAAATIFAIVATDDGESRLMSFRSTEDAVLDEVRKVEELPNFKHWLGHGSVHIPAFYEKKAA